MCHRRAWVGALLAGALALAASGRVTAGMREAIAAYDRGDYAAAATELAPLAEAGDAEAQFYLAYLHEGGLGVEKDAGRAVEWYRRAAESGHDRAQFNLGLAYQDGRGVERDETRALEWFAKAADQGFARAQYKAGEMYEDGRGTRRDLMLAYQWFALAGKQRYEDARRRRKRVAERMTPHQIAEADLMVRLWREAHRK
jgi:hypothetical protein